MKWLLLFLALPAFAMLPEPGSQAAPQDPRYCGEPARNADGSIHRSRTELRRFAAVFPCPATLQHSGACPGWAIDHTIPLATGGCDTVANMTWLPDQIKSCTDPHCKDRWERKYHAFPRQRILP